MYLYSLIIQNIQRLCKLEQERALKPQEGNDPMKGWSPCSHNLRSPFHLPGVRTIIDPFRNQFLSHSVHYKANLLRQCPFTRDLPKSAPKVNDPGQGQLLPQFSSNPNRLSAQRGHCAGVNSTCFSPRVLFPLSDHWGRQPWQFGPQ